MSYAGVGCDPGWVAWAEQETVARLRDQLSDRRVRRELGRIAQARSDDGPQPSAAARLEAPVARSAPVEPRGPEPTPDTALDHPLHTHVTAFSEPPAREEAAWHDWAEAQTILRLQQRPTRRRVLPRQPQPQPEPEPGSVPDLRIEVTLDAAPRRTVRVHHENLKAVGI